MSEHERESEPRPIPRKPYYTDLKERFMDRFSDFEPAVRQAGMIPREGIHPETAINLSVAPSATFDREIPIREDISQEDLQDSVAFLWEESEKRKGSQFYKERRIQNSPGPWLRATTFSPDTDTLFRESVVPVLLARAAETGKKKLLINDTGYPLPFWFQGDLHGITILEGKGEPPHSDTGRAYSTQLERYIVEGKKLPRDIGSVYLDYPSTLASGFMTDELIQFIRTNPDVLFIVDQANQYFSDDLLYEVTRDLPRVLLGAHANRGNRTKIDDCLVFITNTTSKAMANSSCAAIAATRAGQELLDQAGVPRFSGFTDESLRKAYKTLSLQARDERGEKHRLTMDFRQQIGQNRDILRRGIRRDFGQSSLAYRLAEHIGPHFFVDAKALGFPDGEALSDYLASEFSIGTKTAKWYGDTEKHPELLDYVYIGVPVKPEHLATLQAALAAIKTRKDTIRSVTPGVE